MNDATAAAFAGRWCGWASVARGAHHSWHYIDMQISHIDGKFWLTDLSREAIHAIPVPLTAVPARSNSPCQLRASYRRLWPFDVNLRMFMPNRFSSTTQLQVELSHVGMTGREVHRASLSSAAAIVRDAGADGGPASSLGDAIRGWLAVREPSSSSETHAGSTWTTSVSVEQGGRLLAEEYFWGAKAEHAQLISSCTKSLTGLAVGIALEVSGRSSSESVIDFLPDHENEEWAAAGITLQHVLDMTAGTDWRSPVATDGPSTGLLTAADPVEFALRQRPVRPPGTTYVYDNSLPCVAGEAVSTLTGAPFSSVITNRLLKPIGVSEPGYTTAGGDVLAAGGMYLRPKDMLKLGRLLLQRGEWLGRQVVPRPWADSCMISHTPSDTYPYSNYWHLNTNALHFYGPRAVMALGQGGQGIIVLPDFDAVVVATGHNWSSSTPLSTVFTLISDVLIPALRD